MANTKLTKTLEQGVSLDHFEMLPAEPEAPVEGTLAPQGSLRSRRKAPRGAPCRMCAMPLSRGAETAIGVHIRCVADARFKRITIPRPAYGSRKR